MTDAASSLRVLRLDVVAGFPQREAEDVPVEQVVDDVGRVGREPGLAQPSEQRVHVAQPSGADAAGHQQRRRPAVAPKSGVNRDRTSSNGLLPVSLRRGRLALGEDEVEDAVEQVVLVRHVVVEGHRLEAEHLAELPHRHGLDPALVRKLERRLEDALAAEWEAGVGGH